MIDFVAIKTFLEANPTIFALFGMGAGGSLLYSLKAIPIQIWHWAVRETTTTISVTNDEEIYPFILDWLSELNYIPKARNLRLIKEGQLIPGFSTHTIWHNWHPLKVTFVDEDKENKAAANYNRRHKLFLTTLGRSHKKLQSILKEIKDRQQSEDIKVYTYKYSDWELRLTKIRRDFDSLFLNEKLKNEIIRKTLEFKNSKDKYRKLNIPYRLGFLFSGNPGTGKTSIAFAIASLLEWPIYYLNLGSVVSDNQLLESISVLPQESILLMEDVDTFGTTQTRKEKVPDSLTPNMPEPVGQKTELPLTTMSGLLNALDGVIAPEGRILIMTTNYPDKLDEAIVRSGRIDHHIKIEEMEPAQAVDMYKLWFPDGKLEKEVRAYAEKKLTAAAWQGKFLDSRSNPDRLLELMK